MMLYSIYIVALILFALCVYGDAVRFFLSRKIHPAVNWLLIPVWLLQSVIFFIKARQANEFPILTPADGLLFLSWLLVFSSLFAKCLTKKAAIIFFADTIGFALMALDFFKRGGRMTGWNAPPLLSDDLIVHIIIAFLAYALFTLSFIFSIIYTIEYQLLKRKKLYRHLMKFGSLETMDGWIFWADLIGVSLLLISLAIGSLWASTMVRNFRWIDTKVILSFIVLASYCFTLYQRMVQHVHGKPFIYWNVISFLLLLMNVFLPAQFMTFHLW